MTTGRTASRARSPRCLALLRGINVGGRNRLAMRDLTRFIEELGGTNVRTYIQSGNAVFNLPKAKHKSFPEALETRIREDAGIASPVVFFDAESFVQIVENNPFIARGIDERELHVGLLREKPTKRAVASLDPERSPGDSFEVRERAIYLHLPNGVARSKLTSQYLDRTLGVITTARNWRTMLKLRELAEADG